MKDHKIWVEWGMATCALVFVLGAQPTQPKPLTRVAVLSLVAAWEPASTQNLIQQRGISFSPTDEYVRMLGRASGGRGGAALEKTLRGAKAIPPTEVEASTEAALLQHLTRCGELNNSESSIPHSPEAEVECRAALSLAPRDSFVLLAVGTSLSQQDKRKEAAAVYKQAVALDPSLVLGHVLLADALIGAGPEYRDEGLVEGMAALRLDPNSKEAMMLFGFLFTDAGASDHDIATLRSEANGHANDPASRFVLGLALQAADKEKAAIAFLEARKRDTENDTSRKPNGYRVREAKEGLLNGIVHMIEKDTSSFAIVKGDTQRHVIYNSDTKWMYGTQESNKPSSLDELKENWYITCKGTFDGVKLIASSCRFRESK